jgi:hypothetical protein
VNNGSPNARIVGVPATWAACQTALQELQTGIAKSTGVRVPIDPRNILPDPLELVTDYKVQIRFEGSEPGRLGKDGFRIQISSDELLFFAEHADGFLNGVYEFLERYCGFYWFWPGPDGEVYDTLTSLMVPCETFEKVPAYTWRFLWDGDPREQTPSKWSAREFHLQPNRVTIDLFHLWCKRNRLGGLKARIGHMWGELINPEEYGKSHPEFFAEIGGSRQAGLATWTGKHGGQLCTSNPQVVDLFTEKVRNFFDENPGYDILSVAPNDGEGFCECDQCIGRDIEFGNPPPQTEVTASDESSVFKDDADRTSPSSRITGPITDRIFEFTNRIAEKIKISHPDKLLLLLVYGRYREPPKKIRPASNVIAQFCLQTHQHAENKIRNDDVEMLQKIAAYCTHLAVYDYFDQGAWPGVVRLFPDLISDTLKTAHGLGARYFFTQAGTGFAVSGFNLWFLSRALWDLTAEGKTALQLFCRKAFDTAGPIMQEYFEGWVNRWKEAGGLAKLGDSVPGSTGSISIPPFEQIGRLYSPAFIDHLGNLIRKAKDAASNDSAEKRRIGFFEKGFEATRVALTAAWFYNDLIQKGWPRFIEEATLETIRKLDSPDQVLKTARKAKALWDRWEGCLEQNRDNFVLSYFWARYAFDSRKQLHPHSALNKIIQILAPMERIIS